MKDRGLPQEGLKLIACVSMLLDHVGATLVMLLFSVGPNEYKGILLDLYDALRCIGRLAFPIYCFLLAEGSAHTRNPLRYGLRLAFLALLSEIPFDLAFFGGIEWSHQNVMLTLLLGLMALEGMKRTDNGWLKMLIAVPFALAAEWACADYGAKGVLLIALFALTRGHKWANLLQFFGMWCIFSPNHTMFLDWIVRFNRLGKVYPVTQEYALLAMIPIAWYNGKKLGSSKAAQWGFYIFYPAHLLALWLIGRAYGSFVG